MTPGSPADAGRGAARAGQADGAPDIKELRRWVGRTEQADELLTPALAHRFAVTLGADPDSMRDGGPAPPGIHWCLCMTAAPAAELGPDGHPVLGGFLPPVPSARRMWAGGMVRTVRPMRIGATVRRRSQVTSVELKEGRSGRLCFVAVDHPYSQEDEAVVSERHDIVYRSHASPSAPSPAPHPARTQGQADALTVETTPTLLFRYSALTFNGHRIHYDLPYAQAAEGYEGLVVHGPLQATWMLQAAQRIAGQPPREFTFRGVKPLICGDVARVVSEPGTLPLRLAVLNGRGEPTMTAVAA